MSPLTFVSHGYRDTYQNNNFVFIPVILKGIAKP
jgi:hypothetical protein